MDFAHASHAQLAEAGYTVTKMVSAVKRRRSNKWVRPSCNHADTRPTPMVAANQAYRGEMQG